MVNLPARIRIYDAGNNCAAESRYVYGAYYSGSTYLTNVNNAYDTAPANRRLVKTQVALTACSSTGSISDTNNAWAITRYAYEAYGNQVTANQLGETVNLVTNTDFDSAYHAFPIRRYRTVGATTHAETAFYYGVNPAAGDPTIGDSKAHWGALGEWCGVNEVCTRYAYDDDGRRLAQWDGVATAATWATAATAAVTWKYTMYGAIDPGSGTVFKRNVILEWHAPRCYGNFSRKVYDGLGQLLQVQGPQQDWTANADSCNPGNNAKEVDVNYAYDALGNQTRVSVPVAKTSTYINRAADWSTGYTATTYDVLGRPKTVAAPNGETTAYKYVGRTTRLVAEGYGNENGTDRVIKWTETDALGNLAHIRTYNRPWQPGDSLVAEMGFAYDVLGNLRTVTHPDSIGTTTMTYDLAGRKTSMTDLDLGTWSYTYNRKNQLISQTDGRGKTICLYYDAYNRLQGKYFQTNTSCPGAVTTYDIRYQYDGYHSNSNRSRGQLTQIYYQLSGGYYKNLYYNEEGQLTREQVGIPGLAAMNTYTFYDQYLRPYATQSPDGEVVKVNFNRMGLPSLLCSAYWNSGQNAYYCTSDPWYVSDAGYDEAGRLTDMKFPAGGNLWLSRGYFGWTATDSNDPGSGNGRLFFNRVGSSQAGYDKLDLVYYYDSYGNVKRHKDGSAYSNFTYDEQNRITAAYGKSYGYDSIGRMSSYEGSSQTVNNSFPLHVIKQSGYSFAPRGLPNGNLVSCAGGQTLTWNHENQLSAISRGGLPTASYLYDQDGQRVKKTSNGVTTYYVNQLYEVSGGVVTKYYYFGGQRHPGGSRMRKNGTLTYLHSDHLGSTVLETNTSGNPTANQQYCAYGRKRTLSNGTTVCGSGNSLATDHTFTDQKLDATGLQYFNARVRPSLLETAMRGKSSAARVKPHNCLFKWVKLPPFWWIKRKHSPSACGW